MNINGLLACVIFIMPQVVYSQALNVDKQKVNASVTECKSEISEKYSGRVENEFGQLERSYSLDMGLDRVDETGALARSKNLGDNIVYLMQLRIVLDYYTNGNISNREMGAMWAYCVIDKQTGDYLGVRYEVI